MTGTGLSNRAKPRGKLSRSDQRQLQRELAAGDIARADLARKYGVTRGYVTIFAKQYAREIDAIKAQLDNEFAGLWIASKELRIAAYQREYELAMKHPRRDHFEWVSARRQILHAVAEELGQLPPKATVTVIPVQHVIIGIESADLELLK